MVDLVNVKKMWTFDFAGNSSQPCRLNPSKCVFFFKFPIAVLRLMLLHPHYIENNYPDNQDNRSIWVVRGNIDQTSQNISD